MRPTSATPTCFQLAPSSFEDAFVAIVQSSAPDPMDAWTAFYRNTIARLANGGTEPGGTIAEFAPVHERAVSLVQGRDVLDPPADRVHFCLRSTPAGRRRVGRVLAWMR